ncbi:hypothetical protein ACFL04_00855 [Patescibacteria group bacterium]
MLKVAYPTRADTGMTMIRPHAEYQQWLIELLSDTYPDWDELKLALANRRYCVGRMLNEYKIRLQVADADEALIAECQHCFDEWQRANKEVQPKEKEVE